MTEPRGVSPPTTWTMYAVMACIPSRGLPSQFAWAPIAMVTIMVSPMALEMPRITAATIPESAAGTTTFVAVSRLVTPSA